MRWHPVRSWEWRTVLEIGCEGGSIFLECRRQGDRQFWRTSEKECLWNEWLDEPLADQQHSPGHSEMEGSLEDAIRLLLPEDWHRMSAVQMEPAYEQTIRRLHASAQDRARAHIHVREMNRIRQSKGEFPIENNHLSDLLLLIRWLQRSRSTVVLAGAGMGVASGLRTFRAAGGRWADCNPMALASKDAFRSGRPDFREFYTDRMHELTGKQPNAGHHVLASWEKQGLLKAVMTQNVDRFQQMAGSFNVLELHGNLREIHCSSCRTVYSSEQYLLEDGEKCPKCGGRTRPSVVLFQESLDPEQLERAAQLASSCDLFIVIGTGLQVYPAASFVEMAKDTGAKIVILNLEPTSMDPLADLRISGRDAAEVLEAAEQIRLQKI